MSRSASFSDQLSSRLDILFVEDDPDDELLVRETLSEAAAGVYRIFHAATWTLARAELCSKSFDVVLLDLNLPDSSGLELIESVLSAAPDTPIVIVTGLDDEEVAQTALQHGVQDYVVKGDIGHQILPRTIRHAIDRQRLLLQLEESKRAELQLKDEFISHVSHELRSPLSAIYQLSTILLDEIPGELNAEQKEFVEIVFRNAVQLRDMIADLMEVTRAETGKLNVEPREIRLEDPIRDVVRSLRGVASEKRVELQADLSDAELRVLADGGRVRQILGNLVGNAIKFTPSGGRVRVRAAVCESDPSYARITVEDTGRGLSAPLLDRIFERLYQAEPDREEGRTGLGLGLYISKQLVSRHGGRIWVESEPGKGSEFHFTLPLYSLARLIEPTLVTDGVLGGTPSLVSVEVSPGSGDVGEVSQAVLAEVQQLIGECVLRGLDVVLPRRPRTGREETIFIVAAADESGADVMARRISKALDACDAFDRSLVNVNLEVREIELTTESPEMTAEHRLAEVAREIGRLMDATGVRGEDSR